MRGGAFFPGRMISGAKQNPPHIQKARTIEFQGIDGCPSHGGKADHLRESRAPVKMLFPDLGARIVQLHYFTIDGVGGF